MKTCIAILSVCFILGSSKSIVAQPISLSHDNPHYYFYKNKPVVLITSAEHYGGVINKDFDYILYFDMLKSYNLNYTRIYPGYLIEQPGMYMKGNTLAPKSESLLLPWARSNEPGYYSGGNKFDLIKWDDIYFRRLHDFIKKAGERGIVVEICFYNAMSIKSWEICALKASNNIQGIGKCHFNDGQTLNDTALVRIEANYVSKIVREVNAYDNVILEICDETTVHGTPLDLAAEWTRYMIKVIKDTEKQLPKKHLIAQQVMGQLNGAGDFSENKDVSVIVGQYVGVQYYGDGRATYHDAVQEGGILALDDKYTCNKPIEFNETEYYPLGYKKDSIADSRVEAWEFIVGGGAGFNHLNGRFTAESPKGDTPDNLKILNSLKNLTTFINSFDYTHMQPDRQFIVPNSLSDFVHWRVISRTGKQYALYFHHSMLEYSAYTVRPGNYNTKMEINIPPGKYRFEWIVPETGLACKTEVIENKSDRLSLTAPLHTIDMALRINRIE
jgi:hypothetical protein